MISFISEPNKRIYDALNKGLALATGDVIGALNTDDYFADVNVITAVAQALLILQQLHFMATLTMYALMELSSGDGVQKPTGRDCLILAECRRIRPLLPEGGF